MKITDAPTPIATPFAQNGTRNDIPDADPGFTGDTAGRAAFATGFPEITMRPIAAGGVPPFGADFNGILYALSNAVRFYGAGGHYKFNADFAAKIGGYPMGATVQATDNMGHWLNVVEANSTDPESALSTGWLPLADHNGTATVNLTASTALTPLQAAKANLRFTGTPTGNVTVTFPAWTKRYSIINDCTGDGSVICTTGNGESISIKNGAKYEVGCDGKNLTLSTVNASQVFAEANKNISALDAPTVQQLLNVLGSAAAHAASDFDAVGSAKAVQESLDALAKSLANIAKSGNMADAIGTLAIEHGGTGAESAENARKNLGINDAATQRILDGTNPSIVAGASDELPTTNLYAALVKAVSGVINKSTSDDSYTKLEGSNKELLTTAQFKEFLNNLTTPSSLHSYALARPSNPDTGNLVTGMLMNGSELSFCSASGDTGPSFKSLSVGTWCLMGNVFTQASSWPAYVRIASLWVRVI